MLYLYDDLMKCVEIRTRATQADTETVFNQNNVKLGSAIIKINEFKIYRLFLPFGSSFRTRSDLQSRYIHVVDKKKAKV